MLNALEGCISLASFSLRFWFPNHSNFLDYSSPFFRELISVIIAPPITPNNFWGFNKCNFPKLHLLVLSLLGRSTPPITPKYSQRINWRKKFHLCRTRKFSGNELRNPKGPNETRKMITEPNLMIFDLFSVIPAL